MARRAFQAAVISKMFLQGATQAILRSLTRFSLHCVVRVDVSCLPDSAGVHCHVGSWVSTSLSIALSTTMSRQGSYRPRRTRETSRAARRFFFLRRQPSTFEQLQLVGTIQRTGVHHPSLQSRATLPRTGGTIQRTWFRRSPQVHRLVRRFLSLLALRGYIAAGTYAAKNCVFAFFDFGCFAFVFWCSSRILNRNHRLSAEVEASEASFVSLDRLDDPWPTYTRCYWVRCGFGCLSECV